MQPCGETCGSTARNQKEGRWICSTCLAEEKREDRQREYERLQAVWERRDRSLDVVGESRRLDALHATSPAYCSRPGWKYQRLAPVLRVCKHLVALRSTVNA